MNDKFLYLEKFGKAFVPKKFRPYLRQFFMKAGYSEIPFKTFGMMFWISFIITYFIYIPFIYPALNDMGPVQFFIFTFLLWAIVHLVIASSLGMIVYSYANVKIYKRTKNLEEKLPDYLNLVSVNLRGGMSFEKSLWSAIKPEFEVLANEITIVCKSVMTGNDVKDALRRFGDKYDSPTVRRALDLLIGEMEGGGNIVEVIDSVVDNLKKSTALKRELTVASQSYVIFITAIVLFIAPALFAVSQQLLVMVTGFTSKLSGNLASGISSPVGGSGGEQVSIEDFKIFTYVALGIISSFSSMIVSIINKGDVRGGLKYIPIFILVSLMFFFIASSLMAAVFSGVQV